MRTCFKNVAGVVRMSVAVILLAVVALPAVAHAFVLVEKGADPAPVIVYEDAPPRTRQAAQELATYIEKISGALPELIEGAPDPLPDRAIWVGYQPALDGLFPEQNFDFEHPEEILIAATENHLVIAGRDRWNPDTMTYQGRNSTVEGKQLEYGTVNAVYTFLQDHLDVRWLWPGELGEDIIERETIDFEPFEYRYHPQIRGRGEVFKLSTLGDGRGHSHDWVRFQRLQLDSFETEGGHAFNDWWERFHEDHPDYFAFQPDGTRSGFPNAHNVKLCQSNPAVWDQWIKEVERELEENPDKTTFNASPNDGFNSGVCVCDNCRAWDHPQGEKSRYRWEGMAQNYVSMSDRYVTFANRLGEKLKERFPDRDYYVFMMAYGNSTAPPIEAKPADNVLIGYVHHFPFTTPEARQKQKAEVRAWSQKTSNLFVRPNFWYWGGGLMGLPEIAMQATIEDFRFLGKSGTMAIFADSLWEHWGTMAPQYYVMAQMTWDPNQDGEAVLADFYQRGFGEAADEMAAYWSHLERASRAYLAMEDFSLGGRHMRSNMRMGRERIYNEQFVQRADELLNEAADAVADEPEVYQQRVAFVRAGFEFTRRLLQNIELMPLIEEEQDAEALAQVRANWERIEQINEEHPRVLNYIFMEHRTRWLQPDYQ